MEYDLLGLPSSPFALSLWHSRCSSHLSVIFISGKAIADFPTHSFPSCPLHLSIFLDFSDTDWTNCLANLSFSPYTQCAGGCPPHSYGRAHLQEGHFCFECPKKCDCSIDSKSRDHSECNLISILRSRVATFYQDNRLLPSFEPSSGAQRKQCKRRAWEKSCGHDLHRRVV